MTRVLLDASNLHRGGGVQVAVSLVSEIFTLSQDPGALAKWPWLSQVRYALSTEIAQNLDGKLLDSLALDQDRTGAYAVWFSVFGPQYRRVRADKRVAGFADVTLIYPHPRTAPRRTLGQLAKHRIRGALARRWFRGCDRLVVETEAVRERLASELGIRQEDIVVAANALNGVFAKSTAGLTPSSAASVRQSVSADLLFCYVTRHYPHKNFGLLPEAVREVERVTGRSARVLTTLSAEEWAELNTDVRGVCHNVGVQPVAALPAVYAACDVALFPSLLECYSASPLEALASGTPLVASDRDFVRSIVGDAADYFDPESPQSMASAILRVLEGHGPASDVVSRILARTPGPGDRAKITLEAIDCALKA